ncbi:MAG TPA: RtcB family protein [Myxococcota bacterium]|nr:RtcB family protein [Myxococcota bacterium]
MGGDGKDVRWERRGDVRVVIPRHGAMRVDGVVFADAGLMAHGVDAAALQQVVAVATLPGIVGASMAMPDIHWGYGFPIGGVAAFDADEGVVSPGGVGFDINCGVRMLRSDLALDDVADRLDDLLAALFAAIPAGLGSHQRQLRLDRDRMRAVAREGAGWAVRQGYGWASDLDVLEDRGCIAGADFDAVSDRAFERGRDQLGTLGSGNHFAEVGVVDRIDDPVAAEAFGLFEGGIVVTLHTGSRGFGHQVCTDFLPRMDRAARQAGIDLPDRQLACAPLRSGEGRAYLAAMACAANYAFANRQVLSHRVREAFEAALREPAARLGLRVVYDVAHNIAKVETHAVDGRSRQVCVHRKGATRALPAGHPDVPAAYRAVGQPVLVPGDMGRPSYVLAGAPGAARETFASSCHGAGRMLSRAAAIRAARGRDVRGELARRGVRVMAAGRETLAEEMPDAYKDAGAVVDVVHRAGIATRVARIRPLAVVKG